MTISDDWPKENPTKQQEKEVFERYYAGDKLAKEDIVRMYYRMACCVALKFSIPGYDQEDLQSIAIVGLLEALKTFDISKGFRFSTYVMRGMWVAVKKEHRLYPIGDGIRCGADAQDFDDRINPALIGTRVRLNNTNLKGEQFNDDTTERNQPADPFELERNDICLQDMRDILSDEDRDYLDRVILLESMFHTDWMKEVHGNAGRSRSIRDRIESAAWHSGVLTNAR